MKNIFKIFCAHAPLKVLFLYPMKEVPVLSTGDTGKNKTDNQPKLFPVPPDKTSNSGML
jgi:hypothetical protein